MGKSTTTTCGRGERMTMKGKCFMPPKPTKARKASIQKPAAQKIQKVNVRQSRKVVDIETDTDINNSVPALLNFHRRVPPIHQCRFNKHHISQKRKE